MTYHSFEAAGTQTVVPPTGFGVPPYGAAASPPPAGTGNWAGTGPATPPSNGNTANRNNWIIIAGVAAVVVVAAIVSALALTPGPTPHPAPVVTNPASGSAGSSQSPSSQSPSSQSPSSQSPPPQQSSAQQPTTDSDAATDQYLYDLNSQGGDFVYVSDSDLLAYGNAVCSDFGAGNTVQQTVDDAADAANDNPDGLTQNDLATIIGAATATLCPAYGPEVQAWAQANS